LRSIQGILPKKDDNLFDQPSRMINETCKTAANPETSPEILRELSRHELQASTRQFVGLRILPEVGLN
jgi:hypothetical protein